MKILIVTNDELTVIGRASALERLGTEDIRDSLQSMAHSVDAVFVVRQAEGQPYYQIRRLKGVGGVGIVNAVHPLIMLSVMVAGELGATVEPPSGPETVPCDRCGGTAHRKTHPATWTPKEGQIYYYTHWYSCPSCKWQYNPPDAKVEVARQ